MMKNNIDNTTPEMIRTVADDFAKLQDALYLTKQSIMVRFKSGMSTTLWCKELGLKSNKINEVLKMEDLLDKTDKGWKPTEKGKGFFTDKKVHTPILTEKGARYIVDMLCDRRIPFLKN